MFMEAALTELINAKRQGKTIGPKPRPRGDNVVDIMDAFRKSIASEAPAKGRRPRKALAIVSAGDLRPAVLPTSSASSFKSFSCRASAFAAAASSVGGLFGFRSQRNGP